MMNSYKVLIEDTLTTFTYIGTDMMPPFEQVTAVFAVPFTKEGKIVAVNLFSRGYDLPGGHVDEGEKSPEETLRREVMEEASMTICGLVLSEVIESDYCDDRVSYLLLYAAFVDEIHEFVPNNESSERIEVSVDEFIAHYTVGDKELTRIAIEHAWKLLQNNNTHNIPKRMK
jgi:8-oxo-dGTP diphosphatase